MGQADAAPELTFDPSPEPRVWLSMCAVLAAAGRGPLLLDDGTLLDAKGARERLRQLLEPAA